MTDTVSAGAPALPDPRCGSSGRTPTCIFRVGRDDRTGAALFSKSDIGTEMDIANMMGEFTEECGGGFEVEENLNYRAAQLHSQWPLHFSMEQVLEMQHQRP